LALPLATIAAFREFGTVPAKDVSQAFERYPERIDGLKIPD